MTTFDVEVIVRNSGAAVTEQVSVPHGAPATWDEAAVHDVLVETLRAIERVQNPATPRDRAIALTGFSWIVEPVDSQVILAIEIPLGAAVAGPFSMTQSRLDDLVTAVLSSQRAKGTVH